MVSLKFDDFVKLIFKLKTFTRSIFPTKNMVDEKIRFLNDMKIYKKNDSSYGNLIKGDKENK